MWKERGKAFNDPSRKDKNATDIAENNDVFSDLGDKLERIPLKGPEGEKSNEFPEYLKQSDSVSVRTPELYHDEVESERATSFSESLGQLLPSETQEPEEISDTAYGKSGSEDGTTRGNGLQHKFFEGHQTEKEQEKISRSVQKVVGIFGDEKITALNVVKEILKSHGEYAEISGRKFYQDIEKEEIEEMTKEVFTSGFWKSKDSRTMI